MNKAVAAIIVAGVALGGYLMFRPAAAPSSSQAALSGPTASDPSVISGAVSIPGGARYADPSGFSIYIPDGYQATASQDEGAETILIRKAGSASQEIQLYITPYDEPAAEFDAARISKDLPGLASALARSRGFSIAGGHGVEFDDANGHEIWFASAGQLYQITAPASLAATAEGVASSFKLK